MKKFRETFCQKLVACNTLKRDVKRNTLPEIYTRLRDDRCYDVIARLFEAGSRVVVLRVLMEKILISSDDKDIFSHN